MRVSFIWHMHQPDYRNKNGIMQMPWVFMHAIKDYYDMPWIVSKYANMKVTFNITAPLIEQLNLYMKDIVAYDKFFTLWYKDPKELYENERKWLIKISKSSHYETMVKPLPRYEQLYQQERYNDTELLDLEVLFILAWCGVYLKQNNTTVKRLLQKGRDYTTEEKAELLQSLQKFVVTIWDLYKKLLASKQVAIATTPFYHPILPLLLDMQNAKKANSSVNLPKNAFSLYKDAEVHIQKAKELYKETFAKEVSGFWPAEGAVDEQSVRLLSSFGIEWIATDEAILYKSLGNHDATNIYTPYMFENMLIAFRDHRLSDLIGFEYRYQEANSAADSFVSEIANIYKKNRDATLFIVLDGENAWEYYKNNGFDFLTALYARVEKLSWCQSMTMDRIKQSTSVIKNLEHLAAGSWINGTFDTWVGDVEKRRAWELLYMTKRDYERHASSLNHNLKEKIDAIFLVAESSDWFWWYGKDHHSSFDNEFDLLFRNNLIEVYKLMQINPPADLFIPLVQKRSGQDFLIQPQSDISPTINGRKDSFFEWMGCGSIDETQLFSTMESNSNSVKKIYYGQDREKIYFAFEGISDILCKKAVIHIILDPLNIKLKVAFNEGKKLFKTVAVESYCQEWLELSIDKKDIDAEEIRIRFEIYTDGVIIQTLPGFGDLVLDLNDDYSKNWFV